MRRVILLPALLLLAACAMPLTPEDVRLDPGPPITGTVGIGYTNEEVREDLVAPICARRGLLPATVALGPIEDGARRVRASCA